MVSHRCRNAVECLIPGYLLREVVKRGDEAQRDAALSTLGVSTALRSARLQAEARVDEVFEHFGSTWDFLFEALARNSIDDAGMTLDGVVHFERDFDNAFWDGDGDGSGRIFTRMTQSLETTVAEGDLSEAQAAEDGELLGPVDLDALAARSPIRGAGADRHQYDIAVERGGQSRRVIACDGAIPDELAPLVDWLERRATQERERARG